MPNKTIYVSETDLPVFDKAQQMAGGSLSSAISQALRRYVEDQEMLDERFEEVSVEVGRVYRVDKRFIRELRVEKRFLGKQIISWRTAIPRSLAPSCTISTRRPGAVTRSTRDRPNHDYEGDDEEEDPTSELRLDVFDSLDAIRATLPEELYEATVQAASESAQDGEFLDI